MNRLDLNDSGKSPHFIGAWQLEPKPVCDDIVAFFETHPAKQRPGATAGGENTDVKNSTDIIVHPAQLSEPGFEPVAAYIVRLFDCYRDYLDQWPFLKTVAPRLDIPSFNIQRYSPGGHFRHVHTERASLASLHRIFAWMTYLNDVDDGGSTYFPHFDLDIRPEAGKTLIWTAEWTHAHAGQVLNSGVKYIITGWMHFPFED